jgi:hypothetical protein
LASERVKIRSLEKGNPDSDIRKNPSVELSITVGMVYHNIRKGANHNLAEKTFDKTQRLKFFFTLPKTKLLTSYSCVRYILK